MKPASVSLEFRKVDNKVYVNGSVMKNKGVKFVSGFITKPDVQTAINELANSRDEVE